MAAKSLMIFCVSTFFFKMNSAQCTGAINGIAAEELALNGVLGYPAGPFGYGPNFAAPEYVSAAPSSGGGFTVTSSSPIVPTGISVVSENVIEGPLLITGHLPFLGAIALEGNLDTAGAGNINYGCGDGAIGIVSEGLPSAVPATYPAGAGYGAPGAGYLGPAGPRGGNCPSAGRIY